MTNTAKTQQEDSVDLRELFSTLLTNWPIIVICTLLSVLASLVYLKYTKPTYTVNALLQVDSNSGGADALLGNLSVLTAKSPVQSEIEIIRSRLILTEAARQQNLNTKVIIEQTNEAINPSDALTTSHSPNGVFIATDSATQLHIKTFSTSSDFFDKTFQLNLLDKSSYKLALLKDDEVVTEFSGKNNQLNAFNYKNNTVSLFIDYEPSMIGSELTLKKLGPVTSAERLSEALSTEEKGLETGILSLNYEGHNKKEIRDTLNTVLDVYLADNVSRIGAQKKQTLAFLEKQLPELKANLEGVEKKFDRFRKVNNTVDITQESQLLLEQSISFQTKKNELEQKKAELAARFTDDYPVIAQINSQINTLNRKMNDIESRLKIMPSLQRQYFQLFRDVEVNTKLYTDLLNSYQQLRVANAGEVGNVRIIDRAVMPTEAIKPQPIFIVLFAFVLGGILGVGLSLLRGLLNSGIKDASKLETAVNLPVLANVPRSKLQHKVSSKKSASKLLALNAPAAMTMESLRSLRTTLDHSLERAENNIVLITTATPNIGKAFISANLAALFAQSGKRVLLIDGDMRRGHLHDYFDTDLKNGLSGYLNNTVTTEIIKPTCVENLHLIVRGDPTNNPSELMMQQKFRNLLTLVSGHYDVVLIDSSPILAVTDGTIIGKLAGTTLLVARYGKSTVTEIETAAEKLEQSGAEVAGIVFNDVQKEMGSKNNYQYGYQYKNK